MTRRSSGEGGVTWRKDRQLWQGSALDPTSESPLHRRYFYNKEKAVVEADLRAFLVDRDRGVTTESTKDTVGGWFLTWLALRRYTVEPQTWANYERIYKRRIQPNIGAIKLQKLTDVDIKKMYDTLLAKKRKPSTVRATHSVLHMALKDAQERGFLYRLPCDKAPLPKQARTIRPVMVQDAAERFLGAIRGHRMEALYVLALATGMRRGEMAALTWQRVDLDAGVVYVERSYVRFKGGWRTKAPKSEAGLRAITLPADAVTALREHRTRQLAERLALGPKWQDHGLVFTTQTGAPITPHYTSRMMHKLQDSAGVPRCRFHDLRHSHGTMLALAHIDPVVAQQRMGHATIAMTMHYRRAVPSLQDEVADGIQRQMRGGRA